MTQDTPTVEEIVRTLAMALTHSEQGHYDKNEALVRDTISPLVSNTETTNTMTQDTPTVEEIANKRGYFCVEEIVNEYFSTAPHYRGRRALKILLQEKVGTALETYGNARYEEGAKAEMERCKNLVVAHLRTNTYDGNDARVFKTTIEEVVGLLKVK